MDGLIVRQPYAQQLVEGKKKKEFRSSKLPKNKRNTPVYIMTPLSQDGVILGQVTFVHDHDNGETHEWVAKNPVKYEKPLPYKQKFGCVVWQNNVGVWK